MLLCHRRRVRGDAALAAARPPRPLTRDAATRGRARSGVLWAFGAATLIFSRETLGCWLASVGLAVVFGAGRATWEGNFKSEPADDFHDARDGGVRQRDCAVRPRVDPGFLLRASAPLLVAIIVVACSVAAATAQASRRRSAASRGRPTPRPLSSTKRSKARSMCAPPPL